MPDRRLTLGLPEFGTAFGGSFADRPDSGRHHDVQRCRSGPGPGLAAQHRDERDAPFAGRRPPMVRRIRGDTGRAIASSKVRIRPSFTGQHLVKGGISKPLLTSAVLTTSAEGVLGSRLLRLTQDSRDVEQVENGCSKFETSDRRATPAVPRPLRVYR